MKTFRRLLLYFGRYRARALAAIGAMAIVSLSAVAMLYLVEIGTRYLRDRQADAGARLGRVDAWLLPVLMRNTPGYPARSGGHDGLAGD